MTSPLARGRRPPRLRVPQARPQRGVPHAELAIQPGATLGCGCAYDPHGSTTLTSFPPPPPRSCAVAVTLCDAPACPRRQPPASASLALAHHRCLLARIYHPTRARGRCAIHTTSSGLSAASPGRSQAGYLRRCCRYAVCSPVPLAVCARTQAVRGPSSYSSVYAPPPPAAAQSLCPPRRTLWLWWHRARVPAQLRNPCCYVPLSSALRPRAPLPTQVHCCIRSTCLPAVNPCPCLRLPVPANRAQRASLIWRSGL